MFALCCINCIRLNTMPRHILMPNHRYHDTRTQPGILALPLLHMQTLHNYVCNSNDTHAYFGKLMCMYVCTYKQCHFRTKLIGLGAITYLTVHCSSHQLRYGDPLGCTQCTAWAMLASESSQGDLGCLNTKTHQHFTQ